ncbi:MAG: acyl-CoA thioesterase [Proteobacteria bacterium]|nr:acyl-CoA thioesterase [Pseudomonadota bacterium]
MNAHFRTGRLLRFADCDPSGIAYFPAWLNLLNGVVEDFWAHLGYPLHRLILERRVGTPTVRLDCSFVSPGSFGDQLEFALRIAKLGHSSLALEHEVSGIADAAGQQELKWRASQTLVATSLETHKAIAWPADLRQVLQKAAGAA